MAPSGPPLRVLLASWAPFHAGAEVAAERLAVGLRDAGHRVAVALGTRGETFNRMQATGLDVEFVPLAFTDKLRWWRHVRAQRELARLFKRWQPDVIHANDLPTSQMVGQAARRHGIPLVCHHRWIFEGAAIDWLNKFGAERHLFVSQALMNELCRSSSKLAASERAVVYDGLPLRPVPTDADRQEARRRLSVDSNTLIVLFAGQIIERKGVEDLLRAWNLLNAERADKAELFLVGEDLENQGQYRRQMEELAADLGVRCRFVGFQRNVPDWLTAADVCVVPSHVEPLGNATLEAMAHARAVIGCAVGGIPEMIVDGVTGLLVPPRDPASLACAIERLIADEDLRARLGAAARRRCEEMFSLSAHVDAVVAHYRAVLDQRSAAIA
jgi:glycosyltransferase involved in cell wall biosynthesis